MKDVDQECLAQNFVDYFPNIDQVVAADMYLWTQGLYFYFVTYYDYDLIDPDEYVFNYDYLMDESNRTGSVFYFDNVDYVNVGSGFSIYTRDNEPVDLNPNDVFSGMLYSTSYNWNNNGTCYIELDFYVSDVFSEDLYDPILWLLNK